MATFVYTARNSQGKVVHGTQEASTENDAINILHTRELLVTRIEATGSAFQRPSQAARVRRRRRVRIKTDDLLFFASQTATLLEAGVPVLRAIEVGTEQTESGRFHRVLNEIRDNIRAGSTLKDAIARHPSVFSNLWGFLIDAGESSGNLPLALNQIAHHLEASQSIHKKFVSALVYPCVLLAAAVGAVFVFMLKIIPVFSKLFSSFQADLPALTKIVIGASIFTQHYILWMLGGVALVVFLARRFLRSREGRAFLDRATLTLPVFGGFVRDNIMARMAVTLSSLIKSGVSIVKSLEITAHATGNGIYEAAILDIMTQVQQGKTLALCFREKNIFSPVVVQLIAIGEESGKLPEMVARIATYYEERVGVFVARLSVLIEPIILVVVGGIVGVIVVAMFLPIFSLSSIIK